MTSSGRFSLPARYRQRPSPRVTGRTATRNSTALRKSPVRTEVLLAANRANAQECTGPRTAQGKTRVALNAHKHGAHAVNLPDRLLLAGDRRASPNTAACAGRLLPPFGTGRPREERRVRYRTVPGRADGIAAAAWLGARLGALTSKAGMSFSFMGIMLATPPSIKDSDCRPAAADRAGALGAVAPLLDKAATGERPGGKGTADPAAAWRGAEAHRWKPPNGAF
jgi:hypothetical protein